jgi:DNA-binding NtrC family response regulator
MTVERSIVALIDVVEPYRSAFSSWAAQQGLHAVEAPVDLASATAPDSLALAVVQADASRDAVEAVLPMLRKAHARVPVVVLAQGVRIESVVRWVRGGVCEVIELPAAASDVVARTAIHAAFRDRAQDLEELVGSSATTRRLREEIAIVAPLRSTVLVTGETGVGKGLVARMIHRASNRCDEPFVHVDCAALAPTLVESELFGHERGAFTGAIARRQGRLELAGRGTVFLDEIGDLDASLQAKLLRVLQDLEYESVGGVRTRRLEARVIAGTNRDLRRAVEEGRFRADLYFRLDVFRIHVPPLRERASDVMEIARAGIERIARRLQVPAPAMSQEFYARLADYPWPGNVRELMNALERALIRHRVGLLDEDALDELVGDARRIGPGGESRLPTELGESDEADLLRAELHVAGGNVSRVARRLGLPRSTLRYKIERHGLGHLIPKD